MKDSYSQACIIITVQPHPYLHSLHGFILQLHYQKCIQNLIIGCKLATTEYGAEIFSQSQLVITALLMAQSNRVFNLA